MKLIKHLWQSIKDRLHRFIQYMNDQHDRRLAFDREEYLKSVTKDAIRIINFVEKDGFYYGTLSGIIITLHSDEDNLIHRISELRKMYVISKMKEYDNGKNS